MRRMGRKRARENLRGMFLVQKDVLTFDAPAA